MCFHVSPLGRKKAAEQPLMWGRSCIQSQISTAQGFSICSGSDSCSALGRAIKVLTWMSGVNQPFLTCPVELCLDPISVGHLWLLGSGCQSISTCEESEKMRLLLIQPQPINLGYHWPYPSYLHSVSWGSGSISVFTFCRPCAGGDGKSGLRSRSTRYEAMPRCESADVYLRI